MELLRRVHHFGTSERWCQITSFSPHVFPTFAAASSFPGLETDSELKTLSIKISWKIKGGDVNNVRDFEFYFSWAFKHVQLFLKVLFNICSSYFSKTLWKTWRPDTSDTKPNDLEHRPLKNQSQIPEASVLWLIRQSLVYHQNFCDILWWQRRNHDNVK